MRTDLNFTYLSYFEGWKVALRRIKRHVKFCTKIIKVSDDSGYVAFESAFKKSLLDHLVL